MTSLDSDSARWPQVVVHTDGGCQGNPGVGAWACVLQSGERRREHSGGALATTNNRMELSAAIGALRLLKRPCRVTLYTDSDYLRQGITGWIRGWKRNGWKTRDRMPVKNQDLWQELDSLAAVHRIEWKWLKGHAGHAENERCDFLAGSVMDRLRREAGPARLAAALKEFEAGTLTPASSAASSAGLAPPSRLS